MPPLTRSTPFVAASVVAGTTGSHDGWQGYKRLARLGYDHQPRSQGAHRLLGEDPDEILPRVHRVISHLKTWLEGTHRGVSEEHEVGRRALRVLFELLVCASFGPSYVVVPESWSSAPALPGLCDLDEVTDVRRRGR
jgi:ISXO2-like transposase domain